MSTPDQTQRLGFDPDPPVAGQDLKATYDWDGIDVEIIEVTIEFDFNGTTATATCKRPDSPETVSSSGAVGVPSGATSVVASAPNSVDKSAPVGPPAT